jgi:fused signal recognition particle receptor
MFRAFYEKLKQGLSKTRQVFSGVASLFRLKGRVDKTFLAQLEERLYLADVGGEATKQIVERVRQAYQDREITGEVETFVKDELKQMLSDNGQSTGGLELRQAEDGGWALTVLMIAGVNGSGKTTSIAKLARWFQVQEKKVILAACDTFRAAAVDQLTIWSQRLGCDIVKGQQGSDPAAVAFDAVTAAMARKADVLIVDTAGRLHTQTNLMKELERIIRVIKKQLPDAPHETLLVLDATNGQNAIQQAQQFQKVVKCTGIILAKLDGTAKGGSIIPIKQKLNLPVRFIGVGEKLEDLEPFDHEAYVESLFAE